MSKSSRQLTLFDCAGPLSKRSRTEPARSLNVAAADGAISHVQSVHADITDLSDDDSSVLSIRTDLVMQPPTPSPRCSTPVFIDSSSASSDEASISATFSPCEEPLHSDENSQQLTTENMPRSTEFSSSLSTAISTICTAHLTSSSITVTHSNSQLQPGQISNLSHTPWCYSFCSRHYCDDFSPYT